MKMGPPARSPEFRIHAPTGTAFKAALGDRVWGTTRTELDVPYIVLFEITKPGTCGWLHQPRVNPTVHSVKASLHPHRRVPVFAATESRPHTDEAGTASSPP